MLASNLLTSSSYSFSLNAIPMQAGEYVTDIYLDFGKVPVGFQSTRLIVVAHLDDLARILQSFVKGLAADLPIGGSGYLNNFIPA